MLEEKVFTRPCEDCGEPIASANFAGLALIRYCGPCGLKRSEDFELDMQRRRTESLAWMRQEFIRDAKRGIPQRFRDYVWEDFKFDLGGEGNRARVAKLRDYAEHFPVTGFPKGYPSLVLASTYNGVGKTMLASLILGEIIGRYQERREMSPFQMWSASDIRLRLRSAERYGGAETPEDVYRDLTTVWLLIIDDVGKEQLSGAEASFSYSMYFDIIDRRYNLELPVVLTSNLSVAPWETEGPCLVDLMGRAAVSRLMQMTGGQVYLIEGEDRR